MRRETSVRKGGDERRFVLPWSCTYFSKVSVVTPPAEAAKYDVDQKEPRLLKVLNSGNLSRVIFEELAFKNPTRFETEICGGICSSKWIWSASPLISSTKQPFDSANEAKIPLSSANTGSDIFFLRYFVVNIKCTTRLWPSVFFTEGVTDLSYN